MHELDDALRMVAAAAADGPMGACLRSVVFGAAVLLDVAVTALLQTLPQERYLILRSNIVPSGATAHVCAAELASRLHPSGCTVVRVRPASCAWNVPTGFSRTHGLTFRDRASLRHLRVRVKLGWPRPGASRRAGRELLFYLQLALEQKIIPLPYLKYHRMPAFSRPRPRRGLLDGPRRAGARSDSGLSVRQHNTEPHGLDSCRGHSTEKVAKSAQRRYGTNT